MLKELAGTQCFISNLDQGSLTLTFRGLCVLHYASTLGRHESTCPGPGPQSGATWSVWSSARMHAISSTWTVVGWQEQRQEGQGRDRTGKGWWLGLLRDEKVLLV